MQPNSKPMLLGLGAIIVAIVAAAGWFIWQPQSTSLQPVEIEVETNQNAPINAVSASPTSMDSATSTTPTTEITLEEIAQHATKEDCWLAVEGTVYSATAFIPTHPGGDKILFGCGKDATGYFNGTLPGSRQHSETARQLLGSLEKIGVLAQ